MLRTDLRGLSMTLKTSDDIDHLCRPLKLLMSKHLQILAAKGPLRRIYKCLLINSIQGSAEVINFVEIFQSHAEAVLLRTSVRVSLWIMP